MDFRRQPPPPRAASGREHSAITVYQIFAAAMRRGLDAARLQALTGLTPAQVSDVASRVDIGVLLNVWEAIMRGLRDPAFPVDAAREAALDPRSPITYLAQSCRTVGEAIGRSVTPFGDAWTTAYRLDQRQDRHGLTLVLRGLGASRLGERCEAEFAMADVVATMRAAVTDRHPRVRVDFAHPAPARTDAHRELFGIAPRFDAPRTQMVIDPALLDAPLATARPGLATVLTTHLSRLYPRDRGPASRRDDAPLAFGAEIRALLRDSLTDGPPRIDTVARELMVSERTLHRRLAAESTTYRALVDEVRRTLAAELVTDPRLGLGEISARLGFASPRAFRRAYGRWYGTTPRGRSRAPGGGSA
jgi:AraC-like DNA-binding protein